MTTKKVLISSAILIVITILVDIIFVGPHGDYWFQYIYGSDAIFGFIGTILLIKIAKGIGRFIQKDENYYGGGEGSDD